MAAKVLRNKLCLKPVNSVKKARRVCSLNEQVCLAIIIKNSSTRISIFLRRLMTQLSDAKDKLSPFTEYVHVAALIRRNIILPD